MKGVKLSENIKYESILTAKLGVKTLLEWDNNWIKLVKVNNSLKMTSSMSRKHPAIPPSEIQALPS